MKKMISGLLIVFTLLVSHPVLAARAVLAGGCFWCMESDFEKLEGVSEVISGFTGGTLKNPTYNGNHDGHYEAVEIIYDPEIIDYQGIIDHFWVNHDPFDDRGQFCDKGHSYLAAIFVANENERAIAEKSRQAVVSEFPDKTVVTPILDAGVFYPIAGNESVHQNFYKTNPLRYKSYRWGCGRDRRLKDIWGDRVTH